MEEFYNELMETCKSAEEAVATFRTDKEQLSWINKWVESEFETVKYQLISQAREGSRCYDWLFTHYKGLDLRFLSANQDHVLAKLKKLFDTSVNLAFHFSLLTSVKNEIGGADGSVYCVVKSDVLYREAIRCNKVVGIRIEWFPY